MICLICTIIISQNQTKHNYKSIQRKEDVHGGTVYLVSQSWDVAVFHAIRDRYIAKHGSTKGGRWLWNNGSTITSQIWDTVIYAVISFGFGLGWVHTHEGRMQLIGIHTIGFGFAKAETFSVQVSVQRVNDISWQTVVKKEPKNVVAVMSGSLKSYFYFV